MYLYKYSAILPASRAESSGFNIIIIIKYLSSSYCVHDPNEALLKELEMMQGDENKTKQKRCFYNQLTFKMYSLISFMIYFKNSK